MTRAPALVRRPAGTVALSAALALAVAGCSALPAPPPGNPDVWGTQATPSPLPSERLASELGFTPGERAAVRIRNDGCESFGTGSGFAIDAHTVVTNRHVVEDYATLEATTFDGEPLTVTASFTSDYGDLAVLTIEEELPVFVALAEENPPVAEPVTVIGYPDGDELTSSRGSIVSTVRDPLDDEGYVYATSAEAAPGSSGSAAYDDDNLVVGVLYAGDDYGTSYIVPVQKLRDLLDNADRQRTNKQSCDA